MFSINMSAFKVLARSMMFASLMVLAILTPNPVYAQQLVKIGPTDIGGTVVGKAGGEAGVIWRVRSSVAGPTALATKSYALL